MSGPGCDKKTYIPQGIRLAWSLALALAGQVKRGEGGVVRMKGWQLMTVNRGGGVGP